MIELSTRNPLTGLTFSASVTSAAARPSFLYCLTYSKRLHLEFSFRGDTVQYGVEGKLLSRRDTLYGVRATVDEVMPPGPRGPHKSYGT